MKNTIRERKYHQSNSKLLGILIVGETMGLSKNFYRAIAWVKNIIYSDQNILRAFSISAAVFLFLVLCLVNIKFLILPFALGLAVYTFYNPEKLIYLAFFVMFINGYLRQQFNNTNLVGLFLDIIIVTTYLKLLFDFIFLKKFNELKKLPHYSTMLFFILYEFLEIFNPQVSFTQGLYGFRIMALYMLLYFIGYYYFNTKEKINNLLKYLFIMTLAVCIYGLKQYVYGMTPAEFQSAVILSKTTSTFIGSDVKIFSFLTTPQEFASLLALLLPLFLPFIFYLKKNNVFLVLSLLFIFSISTLTFVRGALLAIFVGIFVQVLLLIKNNIIKRKHIIKIISYCLLILVTIIFSLNIVSFSNKKLNTIIVRMKSTGAIFSLVGLTQNSTRINNDLYSIQERTKIWKKLTSDTGLTIFGQGVGKLKQMSGLNIVESTLVDNGFLRIYIENGLIGLIFYLFLVFSLWKTIYLSLLSKERSMYSKYLAIGVIGLFSSYLFINLTSEFYEYTSCKLTVWFIIGSYFGLLKNLPAQNKIS